MKRINKENGLAIGFHAIIQGLDATDSGHPDYTAGVFRNEHYEDVFMDLLVSQEGLCAYTEELITNRIEEISQTWENGKYNGQYRRQDFDSTVDHYDSELKHSGKGWRYSNLFAVLTCVNTYKRTKVAHPLLKPDLVAYDPSTYLKYNFATHQFVPSPDYVRNNPGMYDAIASSIDALGINLQTIIDRRQQLLEPFRLEIRSGLKTYEQVRQHDVKKFYTAFEMSKTMLELN